MLLFISHLYLTALITVEKRLITLSSICCFWTDGVTVTYFRHATLHQIPLYLVWKSIQRKVSQVCVSSWWKTHRESHHHVYQSLRGEATLLDSQLSMIRENQQAFCRHKTHQWSDCTCSDVCCAFGLLWFSFPKLLVVLFHRKQINTIRWWKQIRKNILKLANILYK